MLCDLCFMVSIVTKTSYESLCYEGMEKNPLFFFFFSFLLAIETKLKKIAVEIFLYYIMSGFLLWLCSHGGQCNLPIVERAI